MQKNIVETADDRGDGRALCSAARAASAADSPAPRPRRMRATRSASSLV